MHKWIGIRVSAALATLGGALTLVLAGFLTWTATHPPPADAQPEPALPLKGMMAALAIFFTAFSIWGLATGIGLFRRRGWARASMIIFAVLLVGMGGSALVGILFIRMPESANLGPQTLQNIRLGIAAFYGAMTIIGAWWLLLFNSNSTKQYFAERETPAENARPLSIAIIGWYLLICAVGTAVGAILRMPAMIFGLVITGWTSLAVYTAYTAVQIYLGTGLLQLQSQARVASIVYFALVAANSVAFVAFPGFADRMHIAFQALPAFLHGGQTLPSLEGMEVVMLAGTLVVVAPIWFLVRRRAAFR